MVFVAAEVLDALHLSTQALAAPHVVLVAVAVLGVVATTYVIAEVAVVQARGTDQPSDNLVNLFVRPLATLACPPAQRHAPAVEPLAHHLRTDHVAGRIGGRRLAYVVAEVPQVLDVVALLVGIHLLMAVVAVGAQVLVVGLAAQLDKFPRSGLNSPQCLVGRRVGRERRVPLPSKRQELLLAGHLNAVVALPDGRQRQLLRTALRRRLYIAAAVAAPLQVVAAAVHYEQRRRFRETGLSPKHAAHEAAHHNDKFSSVIHLVSVFCFIPRYATASGRTR